MRPKPVMKPSPGGRWASMPKSWELVADKLVEFFESAFVEKQIDPLARAELALLVLALAAFGAAARFGFRVSFAELFEAIVVLRWAVTGETPEN